MGDCSTSRKRGGEPRHQEEAGEERSGGGRKRRSGAATTGTIELDLLTCPVCWDPLRAPVRQQSDVYMKLLHHLIFISSGYGEAAFFSSEGCPASIGYIFPCKRKVHRTASFQQTKPTMVREASIVCDSGVDPHLVNVTRRDGHTSKRGCGEADLEEEHGAKRLKGTIVSDAFSCDACTKPLKPPVFQCSMGHFLLCSTCHNKRLKCRICTRGSSLERSYAMDRAVQSVLVDCRYADYGCQSMTAYYDKESHESACPHARLWTTSVLCPRFQADQTKEMLELCLVLTLCVLTLRMTILTTVTLIQMNSCLRIVHLSPMTRSLMRMNSRLRIKHLSPMTRLLMRMKSYMRIKHLSLMTRPLKIVCHSFHLHLLKKVQVLIFWCVKYMEY